MNKLITKIDDSAARGAIGSTYHVRGLYGDNGENEGVLAVTALYGTENDVEHTLIIVGSPSASPMISGYLPSLGGFSGSPESIEALIEVLRAAVDFVRRSRSLEQDE